VLFAARSGTPDASFPLREEDASLQLRHNELFDIDLMVSFYDVLKRFVDRVRPG